MGGHDEARRRVEWQRNDVNQPSSPSSIRTSSKTKPRPPTRYQSGALRAAASRPPRSLLSAPESRPPFTAEEVAATRRLAADRDRSRLRLAAAEASRAASGAAGSGGASSGTDRVARVLPAEARLAMLLRARALKLAPRQQALRAAVLADERRARAVMQPYDSDGELDLADLDELDEPSGDPSLFLAEFCRWRIAAPWQLGNPEHYPKPPRATAEAQEANAQQAKSEYKHLLRLGAQAAKSMTQAERRAAAAAAAAQAAQLKRQRQEDAKRARIEANAELEAMRAAAAAAGGFTSAAAANHFQQLSAAAAAREAEAAAWAAKERAERERLDRALALLEAERAMLERRSLLVLEATAVLRNPDPERGLRARRNAEDRRRAQRNTWARSWHGREQRRIAREGAARVAALKVKEGFASSSSFFGVSL